eukprot:CAMPEP_0171764364 /NCGR_PEP_ID=MMETSP0991-20121206/49941_1 /TAXON_ID=483369 /ORGANISM="non described non described, Strain CCMP2098" /LENGTH=128 /DNA_ID=CAMNT_0012368471 /DNA_START=734 /DNA_END=1116 /DNA_ORIENTATION=-
MGTGDGAADETGDGAADGTEGCGVGLGEGGRVGVGVGGSEGSVEGFIVGAKVGSPVGGGLWYRKSEGGAGRENAVRGAQERCAINIELPMTRTEFDTRATIPLGVKKGELVRLERAQVWQIVLVQIFD